MNESPHPLHPDPEIAASLEFEPVPRKNERVDGWIAEKQRAFIAALAVTGSPLHAARELGMKPAGVEKLRKDEGGESFAAAWDRALEIHRAQRSGKLRETLERLQSSPERGGEPAQLVEGPWAPAEPLPVICDKCAAEGIAGDEAFADIPYLLAFDPVPRPAHDRLWDAPTQRAFVAALAVTGSIERAARSIRRHAFAIEKLRKSRGAREFNEACEAALDVARQRELAKIGGRLSELGSEGGARTEDEDYDPEHIEEVRARIFGKLEKLRRRTLAEEVIPYPEKRAAWIVLNGAEEIEAIENGTWKPAKWPGSDDAVSTGDSDQSDEEPKERGQ